MKCMIRELTMRTQEERQLRLIASLVLAMIFAAYLGTTAHADTGTDYRAASISKVNGSVTLHSNERAGNVSTVNGSVRVNQHAQANRIKTVNGTIRLDDNVRIETAETVNGTINVARNAQVRGNLTTVNGAIRMEPDSSTGGNVSTVNGLIQLTGAKVDGDLTTVNGNVLLRPGSVVQGDIVIREVNRGQGFLSRLFWPFGGKAQRNRVDIGPDTVIGGSLHLYREVDLYIHDTAQVNNVVHHY
jgi:predicted acyltransferase (DUF342 family)